MIRRVRIYIFLFFVCTFFLIPGGRSFAQEAAEQKELKTLREEIRRFEKELQQKDTRRKAAAELVNKLDREIDLTSAELNRLKREGEAQRRQLEARGREIEELEAEIARLKEAIKRRLISFYKYGRRREVELLLIDGGWRRLDVWLRYQKMIAENDRRNFRALAARREKLQRERALLEQQRQRTEALLLRQQHTAESLKQSRALRAEHLKSLQKDVDFLRRRVKELESAQRQIESQITELEKRRRQQQQQQQQAKRERRPSGEPPKPAAPSQFAQLQGRLPWPTEGTIVSRFGRYRHPTLNTVTENLGIEISAPYGAPVRAVADGRVETITWQRGRGNIIIISHDGDYYTVYTHLSDINVSEAETVTAGRTIGSVGDSGSLNGPILHFQIWKNTENLDPEKWLSKRGAVVAQAAGRG